MVMPYSTNLLDPRWQKKKAEIYIRDKWACRLCEDTTGTLHVHHRIYLPGKQPWEYDDKYLITLCDCCHKAITILINNNTWYSITFLLQQAIEAQFHSRSDWRIEYFQSLIDKYRLAQEFLDADLG